MKIKDITEGWGTVASNMAKDFVGVNRQDPWINKRKVASQPDPKVAAQQQAAGQFKSNPARDPVEPQQPVSSSWITTPDGVQIKSASGNNPTFARYNKQVYRLSNDDRWLDIRDKPVSQTMMSLLNNALEQT